MGAEVALEPRARELRHLFKRPRLLEEVAGSGHDDELFVLQLQVGQRRAIQGDDGCVLAAAAPVLAPKYPACTSRAPAWDTTQSVAPASRSANRPMSNRNCPVAASAASSGG